ncbi:MAG: glycosyltransferase family 39 protein [Ardenticatenaceae bacterium]|nr:glycosyltransferase family 39 protein [Ardenticatenaceae bacterium]
MSAFLLALFIITPGAVLWLVFGHHVARQTDLAEQTLLILLLNLILFSWFGLILAELGQFSLANLTLLLYGTVAITAGIGLRSSERRRRIGEKWRLYLGRPLLLMGGWVFLGILLSFIYGPPSDYVVGGRDHGIYVNTGIHIARSGQILMVDEALTEVPSQSQPLLINTETRPFLPGYPGPWSHGQRLSGLTIRSLEDGVINPHAFHLYPIWFAIFFAVGGLDLLLWPTFIFSFLGMCCVWAVVRRLYGSWVAWGSVIVLASSTIQIWFSGYPTAEILLQPLFWGGLFLFVLWQTHDSRFAALMAGILFGLMHLTKLDTVFVPLALMGFMGLRWLTGRPTGRFPLFFWLPYGALFIHTAFHAVNIATIYFIDQSVRVLLPDFLALPLAQAATGRYQPLEITQAFWSENQLLIGGGIVSVIVFSWLIIVLRRRVNKLMGGQEISLSGLQLITTVLISSALLFLFLSQISPWTFTGGVILEQLGWYLSPLIILLGIVGVTIRLWQANTSNEAFVLTMILLNVSPFFFLGGGTSLDHFWAMRRLMTILAPSLLIFSVITIDSLRIQIAPHAAVHRPVTGAGIIILATMLWLSSVRYIRIVENEGLQAQLSDIAAQTEPGDVLLTDLSRVGIEIGTPLWLVFDRPTYLLDGEQKSDPNLDLAIASWQANGRSVYWLDQTNHLGWNDTQSAYLTNYTGTSQLNQNRLEEKVNAVPNQIENVQTALDFYILEPATETESQKRQLLTLAIAYGDDQYVAGGLYPPEPRLELEPRRWTSERVRLILPAVDPAQELLFNLSNPRPADAPQPQVRVYVEDQLLATLQPTREATIYRVPLNGVWNDPLDVVLEVEPWIPASTGHNQDTRPLGVHLSWVKLVTEQNKR